jgi:hypothetical protein
MGSDSRRIAHDANLADRFLRAATPPLMHGLRLTCAVCVALLVTFYLELSGPYRTGTTAAVVCLSVLGATLRKGFSAASQSISCWLRRPMMLKEERFSQGASRPA